METAVHRAADGFSQGLAAESLVSRSHIHHCQSTGLDCSSLFTFFFSINLVFYLQKWWLLACAVTSQVVPIAAFKSP